MPIVDEKYGTREVNSKTYNSDFFLKINKLPKSLLFFRIIRCPTACELHSMNLLVTISRGWGEEKKGFYQEKILTGKAKVKQPWHCPGYGPWRNCA